MDPNDYDHHCKYCSAKPIAPGPHHANTCKRYCSSMNLKSEEANRYTCKHCGVKPFVAGPHHKEGCKRREGVLPSTTSTPFSGFSNDLIRKDYIYRDKAEIDWALEQGKIACKNADYFHNHPTYDFNKK